MNNNDYRNFSFPMNSDDICLAVPNAEIAAEFLTDVFSIDKEINCAALSAKDTATWLTILDQGPDEYYPEAKIIHTPKQQNLLLFTYKSKITAEQRKINTSYVLYSVEHMQDSIMHIKKNIFPKWPQSRFILDEPVAYPRQGHLCSSMILVAPWGMWIELIKQDTLNDWEAPGKFANANGDKPHAHF